MPRRPRKRSAVVLSIAALCSLAAVNGARADGDPASDTLYRQTVFYSNGTVSPTLASELEQATQAARQAGRPVRVALIATAGDLGAVTSLFGRPSTYARFLGTELEFVYPGRLLVVMPQGAALSQKGRLIDDPAVAKAKVGPGGDGLARTALLLVRDLSSGTPKRFGTARTAPVPAPPARPSSTVAAPSARSVPAARGVPMWEATVAACAAVSVLVGGGLVLVRRRAPTPGPPTPPAPAAPPDANDPYRYTGPF